jgi:hypothetical protein
VDRPGRQARRRSGKSDPLDAVEAARAALSGRACGAAKSRDGNVEAIRALVVAKRSARSAKIQALNQIRHLSFTAPEQLRQRLAGVSRHQADLFSIFGPANWLIHAVNIAAELGNGAEAVRRAERVPAGELPPFLAERRTFLLLGKARGYALCNDNDSAAGVLLDAEQAAPEETRHNPEAPPGAGPGTRR